MKYDFTNKQVKGFVYMYMYTNKAYPYTNTLNLFVENFTI